MFSGTNIKYDSIQVFVIELYECLKEGIWNCERTSIYLQILIVILALRKSLTNHDKIVKYFKISRKIAYIAGEKNVIILINGEISLPS